MLEHFKMVLNMDMDAINSMMDSHMKDIIRIIKEMDMEAVNMQMVLWAGLG